jgi:hypothetical protein
MLDIQLDKDLIGKGWLRKRMNCPLQVLLTRRLRCSVPIAKEEDGISTIRRCSRRIVKHAEAQATCRNATNAMVKDR